MYFGLLDYRLHEEIFESYNYKHSYLDKSIPYLMFFKDGMVYHLEQKPNWGLKALAEEF